MVVEDKTVYATDLAQYELPDLESEALLSLTRKIETKLRNPVSGDSMKAKSTERRGKKKEKKVAKVPEGSEVAPSSKCHPPSVQKPGNGRATSGKKQLATAPKSRQGKKRLSNGQIKEQKNGSCGQSPNSIKLGQKVNETLEEKPTVEDDIRALGGTEDDQELIANVPSNAEVDGQDLAHGKTSGVGLKKDLDQMVRKLGIGKVGQMDVRGNPLSEDDGLEPKKPRRITPDTVSKKRETYGVKPDKRATWVIDKAQSRLILQPQPEWHAAELPALPAPLPEQPPIPLDLSDLLHEHAKSLLENENKHYTALGSSSSARQFYPTLMSTGTLSDKISALTLSVQESPIHNVRTLESLVGLARKRSRGQAVDVLRALKDLFGPGNLLPSNRRLRTFTSQPGLSTVFGSSSSQWTPEDPLPKPLREIHLLAWAYEDWLKGTFFEVLKILETWCNDEVVFARREAVDFVSQLLRDKPEQEANLLRLLVNKLGDSEKKIASRTSFNILQLETTHPLMKPTIIAAIESDLLFRPGQSLHAKYYATITLNQTVLSSKEDGVAGKLLDIYFALFIKLLQKPEPTKDVATGANNTIVNKKGEIQGGGGPAGKKARKKHAESEKSTMVDDELGEKLLSAVLTGVNRAIPYANTQDEFFEKHLDTLFRVTHSSNFNTGIQALMLLQQLTSSHHGSEDRLYRTLYESLLDQRLLTSSKQALYLNLVFRTLKADLNVKRVKAFAKRLLQVVAMHQPPFTCATIYMLRELESTFPSLQHFIDDPEQDDSDDEEEFRDVQEENSPNPDPTNTPQPSKQKSHYDGRKRDPSHASTQKTSLWELTPFLTHYHPSVSLFATCLLNHSPMPPKPDLSLNTLIHFLDRFVYRNPKARPHTPRGVSIMQPLANNTSLGGSGQLVSARSAKGGSQAPVNSEAFWKRVSGSVGADEVFFHKYFSTLGRGKEKAKMKKAARKKEGSESGDEEEIWKALVESRPELEGEGEGSSEGVFSGMEDEDEHGHGGDETVDFEDMDMGSGDEEDGDGDGEEDLGDDEDMPDLGEEDDALVGSDEEVPDDLDKAFERELQGRKRETRPDADATGAAEVEESNRGTRNRRKRRLRNLPTFASAEEYAELMDRED